MNFLDNLTRLLESENLSRAQLAKRLEIAPSTINSWYNRGYENVSLKFLLKICNYFDVSLETLVNGNVAKSNEKEKEIIENFIEYYEKEIKNVKKWVM